MMRREGRYHEVVVREDHNLAQLSESLEEPIEAGTLGDLVAHAHLVVWVNECSAHVQHEGLWRVGH